jgi:hypothetical protein
MFLAIEYLMYFPCVLRARQARGETKILIITSSRPFNTPEHELVMVIAKAQVQVRDLRVLDLEKE